MGGRLENSSFSLVLVVVIIGVCGLGIGSLKRGCVFEPRIGSRSGVWERGAGKRAHLTESQIGVGRHCDPSSRRSGPLFLPVWSTAVTSLHPLHPLSSSLGFLWEPWQLESPARCSVRGHPAPAAGVHKGNAAKAFGRGRLSETRQPSCRGAHSPFPEWRVRCPCAIPFPLVWKEPNALAMPFKVDEHPAE